MEAKEIENLELLGLELPLARRLMDEHRRLGATDRALFCSVPSLADANGILTFWHIHVHGKGGQYRQQLIVLGLDQQGERSLPIERLADRVRDLLPAAEATWSQDIRLSLVRSTFPELLRRELMHKGVLNEHVSFSSRLLAWIEVTGEQGA
jgi:hypothetical protein